MKMMNNAAVVMSLSALAALGCQEIEQPTTVLTAEQWAQVKKHILSEAPAEVTHKVGAVFGNKIELIGFNVDGELAAGKSVTFTWYWRALEDVGANWKIFVHLDSQAKPHRQNIDHDPVEGMYPTGRWKKGQIIEDVQKVTLLSNYPNGQAVPYIGLYRGSERMPVSNNVPKTKERQPRVIGPKLTIKGAAGKPAVKRSTKPNYAARIATLKETSTIKIDGKLEEAIWTQLPAARLVPFRDKPAPLTWVKMLRDDTHLYIAAFLKDESIWSTIRERDGKTWTEEVIEVFIDPDGDGKDYLELQVSPLNTVFDAKFAKQLGGADRDTQINEAKAFNLAGLETAVHVDGTVNADGADKAWSVEIKVPLASLPGVKAPPKPGEVWRANFYRFDSKAKGDKQRGFAWSTEPRGNFHKVSGFGTLRWTKLENRPKPKINPELLKKMGADPTNPPGIENFKDARPPSPSKALDAKGKKKATPVGQPFDRNVKPGGAKTPAVAPKTKSP